MQSVPCLKFARITFRGARSYNMSTMTHPYLCLGVSSSVFNTMVDPSQIFWKVIETTIRGSLMITPETTIFQLAVRLADQARYVHNPEAYD